ncbi:MAG: ABC transporter ATP-binding protein [Reyranellaceae bacterium]
MSGDDSVLEIAGLTVGYGAVTVVNDLTLRVRRNRIATIVGSNGAGKTTVMKTIAGLLKPTAGSIRFEGRDIAGMACDDIVRSGIALVPEGRRLFASMTVIDNLRTGAYLRDDKAEIARSLDMVFGYFPILAERREQIARSLSGGQQQMLAVGRALMSKPRLLLLDEPSIGLAPVVVDLIASIVTTVSQVGVDVLIVEQNAALALELAEDAYVLENGRLAMAGKASELAQSDAVRQAYLGM